MPTPRKGETREEMNARYRDSYTRRWQEIRQTVFPNGATSTVLVPERPAYKPIDKAFVQRRSSLVDAEGNIINQWIIEKPEEKQRREALEEYLERRMESLPAWEPIAAPDINDDMKDYMVAYPIGDHHMGMLAWHRESGTDHDLKISRDLLIGAMDHLVQSMVPAENALITFLGDFGHYDSMQPLTPQHSNLLDADSRAGKMVEAIGDVAEYVICLALEKHAKVGVLVEAGNHDPFSTIWLRVLLNRAFRNNPRITVDMSPSVFHYCRWESVLIMTHHGDRVKMEDLPLIMATDRPQDWGETKFRHIYTGHTHRQRALDVKGVSVESFRVLPPTDAWAHQQGYRPIRDMKAIMYHKDFGEVGRYTFNPDMLHA